MEAVNYSVSMVPGAAFDDMLEGYVPLEESVCQMMARNGICLACFTLVQAPIMELPSLAANDPVPLRLPVEHAGLVKRMDLVVSRQGGKTTTGGTANWNWRTGRREKTLPLTVRLSEPAFIRGIALRAVARDNEATNGPSPRDLVNLVARVRFTRPDPVSLVELVSHLGWHQPRAWRIEPGLGGTIHSSDDKGTLNFDIDFEETGNKIDGTSDILVAPVKTKPE